MCLFSGMAYWTRLPHGAAYPVGGPDIDKFETNAYNTNLNIANNVFTWIFFAEMVLKLSAWGYKQCVFSANP